MAPERRKSHAAFLWSFPARTYPPFRFRACSRLSGADSGRYVPENNYHITLAFLGDVHQARVCEASAVLARCIGDMQAPLLTLGETDFFGRAQNAILIAHVLSEPSLLPVHDVLIRSLEAASLPFDSSPFSPHITLARHARIENGFPPAEDLLSFVPDCAHLYLSARNEQNVLCYTPIASAPFAKSRGFSGKFF